MELFILNHRSMSRAGLIAVVTFLPVLASILSFVKFYADSRLPRVEDLLPIQITYAATGHDLNVAIIFSSLQFFNVCDFLLLWKESL